MNQTPTPPPEPRAASPSALLSLMQFLLRMVGTGAMGLANVLLHGVLFFVLTGLVLYAWSALSVTHYSGPTGAAAAAQQSFRVALQAPDGPRVMLYRDWLAQSEAGKRWPAAELPQPDGAQPAIAMPPGQSAQMLQRQPDGSYALSVNSPLRSGWYRYRVVAGEPQPLSLRTTTPGMAAGSAAVGLLLLWALRRLVARMWPNSRLLR